MAKYNLTGIKGLTANDRILWEGQNKDLLMNEGYKDWEDLDKDRYFKNVLFKNKFGDSPEYKDYIKMNPEKRDSIYTNSIMTPQQKLDNTKSWPIGDKRDVENTNLDGSLTDSKYNIDNENQKDI